ncbi:hypothetical protein HUT00_37180 [Pseudomonas chlororaphis]|nr:hypothetical protein [Pseudomonas chlororaphis]
MDDYLFSGGSASDAMTAQINSVCVEISKLPEKRILETDPDALASFFIDKYDVEIPVLVREGIVATHHESFEAVSFCSSSLVRRDAISATTALDNCCLNPAHCRR